MAAMAALISSKVWFIHCFHSSGSCWLSDNRFVGIRGLSLERLCTLFHERWPKQRSIQLEISVWQAKRDSQARVIMWNMTLRGCFNKSIFLLFSLSRKLSPFLLHEHVLSLLVSKLCILSFHSLYKFHVSCFVISHFNRLPRPLFPRSSTLIVIFMIIWLFLVQLA